MITLMMTLRTKYEESWSDFLNLEEWVSVLDDYEYLDVEDDHSS